MKRLETTIAKNSKGFSAKLRDKTIIEGVFEDVFSGLLRQGVILCYKGHRVIAFEKDAKWEGVDTFAKISQMRLTIAKGTARIAFIQENTREKDNDSNVS